MKRLFGVEQLVAIGIVVLGAWFRQPAIIALGIAGWIGTVVLDTIRETASRRSIHDQAQGQAILRPIQRLHRDIEKIVTENPNDPTVKVIGRDALNESKELMGRAAALASLVGDSRGAADSLAAARAEIARLRSEGPQSDALKLAIDARENEAKHYERLIQTIDAAKTRISEAEVALTAIKGQLAAAVAGGATDGLESESLSGMVGRLKSLSSSLEEVEEMREQV